MISIKNIDLSLLNYPGAISDIRTFIFLPKKSSTTKTILVSHFNHDKLLSIIRFYWQLDVKMQQHNEGELLRLINIAQIQLSKDALGSEACETIIPIYVDAILREAIYNKASDLHIELVDLTLYLRFRIDGILQEFSNITTHLCKNIVTRIKILANMNTAEHILPQDGNINFYLDDSLKIEARVATIPIIGGEKIVIRFHYNYIEYNLDTLFFEDYQRKLIEKILRKPQGAILVTGPTGSGKTTTLYSFLNFLDSVATNIISIENPVEKIMPRVSQINVKPENGFGFPQALRAILRLDPDVIMIGEIRDQETANLAYSASETGHLVLASLHSNNAVDAINRLQTLGIDNNQIFLNTNLIIAQRLLRKNCDTNNNSLNGQIAIFEMIGFENNNIIHYSSLYNQAKLLVQNQITTDDEIIRVFGEKIE